MLDERLNNTWRFQLQKGAFTEMLSPWEKLYQDVMGKPSQGNAEEILTKKLASIPDRYERLLRFRYGISDGIPKTLKETGQRFVISSEWTRELENRAKSRLFDLMRPKTKEEVQEQELLKNAEHAQDWNLIEGYLPYVLRADLAIFDGRPDARKALAKLLRRALNTLGSNKSWR